MTLIREMQDAKIGEREREKKKEKMWSKVITVKKGELLMPDHKRLDQPDRSKSISTYSLEKMMFLSHPKKQVRFDFTSTKILHVTQIFGEIHDSNAPVSRTFCTWCHYVCLFCFCCWISRHHRSGLADPSPLEISSLIKY